MHGEKKSNRSYIELLKVQLESAGWVPSDLFVEPALRARSGVYRPAFVLAHNLYPLAMLDLARADELVTGGDVEFGDTTESRFRVHLESDGTSTWQRGAKEGHHWSPVPSPRDLWLLLGRHWSTADPRLQPSTSEQRQPGLHQVLAVGAVLDAVDAGRSHIQVLMPQGSGKPFVAQELVCKLLRSGFHRRVLWLTTHRAIAEQSCHLLKEVAWDYDVTLLPQQKPTDLATIQVATLATLLQPSSNSRLDFLSADLYDLILVMDLRQKSEGWRTITRHFPGARVIGFSDTPYYDSRFGEPVFQYTIDEALSDEEIRTPDGFRVVRLGDVAEISAGMRAATNPLEGAVPIINARSLPSDGIWTTSALQGEMHSEQRETLDPSVPPLQSSSYWSTKNTLRADDILISAILNPGQPRIAKVPPSVSRPLFFHSSVYRVRVTDSTIEPDAVLAFLRSDAGIRSIQRFASYLGGHLRVTARDLAQLPIFVPEAPSWPAGSAASTKATEQRLSAAGQALQAITEAIIPGLEALEREAQGHDPRIIAARLREIAASLAPPALSERVMSKYPMPIALAYRRFHDSRFNVYEQVLRLRDLFESAAFFVYNTVLADALRRLPSDKYAVPDRGARTAYDGFSMANRIAFVEHITTLAKGRSPSDIFLPDLCESSFVEHARYLQSDFRNRISHSATATESRQRALLAQYQPIVESLLDSLSFMENYRLARVASLYVRDGKCVRRIELYQGVTPAMDEQTFEPNGLQSLPEHDHLVLLDESDDHLDLYPLYQFVANEQTGDDTHMCCFKQRRVGELVGESVQAPIEVTLAGYVHFETLRSRL